MATKIHTDGRQEEIVIPPYENGQLEFLQAQVGGYIETIPTADGKIMVLDEEGKLKDYPYNPIATALVRGVIADDDFIVGDVVITTRKELGE